MAGSFRRATKFGHVGKVTKLNDVFKYCIVDYTYLLSLFGLSISEFGAFAEFFVR